MTSQNSQDLAHRAEAVYQQLKPALESNHRDAFVAIEPDSGDYFLGRTLSEAIQAARRAHPQRLAYVVRVGHAVAVHIGACV